MTQRDDDFAMWTELATIAGEARHYASIEAIAAEFGKTPLEIATLAVLLFRQTGACRPAYVLDGKPAFSIADVAKMQAWWRERHGGTS